ncbi:hypothetical protein [Yeosuana marina]|uniref:hypothetical protein n=1 Tax=Yeosuana marina TaxID=1565536 RepID=UPI0030EE8317
MKKNYLFFLFILICLKFQGQTNCSEADSDVIYAYSDVKTSYEANNISHLKEYAYKSLMAFKRALPKLKDCGCETSYNHAFDAVDLLEKVEPAETYEDGRFFVKRARDIAKESIIELDKCTAADQKDNSLSQLKDEQETLKQQQLELQQKEKEIRMKLAAQKEKALMLKKEQMITEYKSAISVSVKNYNDILKISDSKNTISVPNESADSLNTKSIDEIKTYYLKSLKGLASTYMSYLNDCED